MYIFPTHFFENYGILKRINYADPSVGLMSDNYNTRLTTIKIPEIKKP
jgi:hypothetical protein